MISFVALLELDFRYPSISLPGIYSAFVLQASPSEVTGNNTGLAGWAYWALSFVALIHHLYALKRIPNLYTHYIGWPSCVVSALSFTGIITYLITFVLSTPHLRYLVRYTSAFYLFLFCVLALLCVSTSFWLLACGRRKVGLVLRCSRCKTRKVVTRRVCIDNRYLSIISIIITLYILGTVPSVTYLPHDINLADPYSFPGRGLNP